MPLSNQKHIAEQLAESAYHATKPVTAMTPEQRAEAMIGRVIDDRDDFYADVIAACNRKAGV